MIILAHYTFTVIVISIAIVKKLTIYVKKLVDLENNRTDLSQFKPLHWTHGLVPSCPCTWSHKDPSCDRARVWQGARLLNLLVNYNTHVSSCQQCLKNYTCISIIQYNSYCVVGTAKMWAWSMKLTLSTITPYKVVLFSLSQGHICLQVRLAELDWGHSEHQHSRVKILQQKLLTSKNVLWYEEVFTVWLL